MQVLLNGKPIDGLSDKLSRQITARRERDVAEGVVMSADEIVAATQRAMKWLFGGAAGLAGVIMILVTAAAVVHESKDLTFVLPAALAGAAGLGWLMVFTYRRNTDKARARAGPRLARMPPPGTAVRADQEGLTIGGRRQPWPALGVEAVEIIRVSSEDSVSFYIETLVLDVRGRSIALDSGALTNGRYIVDKAWRHVREQAAASLVR